jgi:hypothetical protein
MNLDYSEKAKHYRVYPIEQVDIIAGNGLSYFQGNALKYITRWRHKVSPMEDLDKCRKYLEWEIERIQHMGTLRKWLVSLWLCVFNRTTYAPELILRENNYPTFYEKEIVSALVEQSVSLKRKHDMLYGAINKVIALKRRESQ